MARLLNKKSSDRPDAFGAKALFIRDLPYENTAAKFWSGLLDEIQADYATGTGVSLSAPTGGLLMPGLLNPETALAEDMERLADSDLRAAFQDAVKALEIIGPPCGVRLRVLTDPAGAPGTHELLLDYLDAEILPFLVVWLLEWAGVPDALWNEPLVRGHFAAEDRDRQFRYSISFVLRSRHLSEGLFNREVVLKFQRERIEHHEPAAKPAG